MERVYSIPESNVCHIHGCRLLDNNYIIGHNNYRNPSCAYDDDAQMPYIQDTWEKIISWMNDLLKDTSAIISTHQNFFASLSDIKCVTVYGHSFNEVDWPYMKEIVRHIGVETPWYISQHSLEDSERIASFTGEARLTNVKTFGL